MASPSSASQPRTRRRLGEEGPSNDRVPTEAPLSIGLEGEVFATTMRTPGHDEELALGFLLAEGLIRGLDDVDRVVADNGRVNAWPAPGFAFDHRGAERRRGTLSTSSCGICGRASIDDLMANVKANEAATHLSLESVERAVADLHGAMTLFERTGAVHGAALYDHFGARLVVREDVGRHNAIDKTLGALLREGLAPALLAISGRASFEVVQKAAAARVPIVATRKGVTSLAVDAAARAQIALVSFLRNGTGNVFGADARIR
ncbi:MAG: formate dehydrogenase accessory sulfurtransferase FdhD [Myxococcota bacterium]